MSSSNLREQLIEYNADLHDTLVEYESIMDRVKLLAHELEGLLEPVQTKKPFLDNFGQKVNVRKIKGLPDFDYVAWNQWRASFVDGACLYMAPVFVARTDGTFTVGNYNGMKNSTKGYIMSWTVDHNLQKIIHEDLPFVRMPKIVLEHASRKRKLSDS